MPFVECLDGAVISGGRAFEPTGNHRDLWGVHRARDGVLWIVGLGGAYQLVTADGEGAARSVRFRLDAQVALHEYDFTPDMVYAIYETPTARCGSAPRASVQCAGTVARSAR